MTAVDPVVALRDAARRAGLACTSSGNLRVAMIPAEYLVAAAAEIEELRAEASHLRGLCGDMNHSYQVCAMDRDRFRDERDALLVAYSKAEHAALELFMQRNAARDAVARHADGEGR